MLSTLQSLRQSSSKIWFTAYIACGLIPFFLITNRGLADTMVSLIGGLFLLHSWQQKDWVWLRDPLICVGLLAWGWMVLVVTPFAHNIVESAYIALPWIRYLLLFSALTHWVLVRKDAWMPLAVALAVLMSVVAIDTLWQYMTGISLSGHEIQGGRLTGPLDNVKVGIFMAKLLIPTIGIGLYLSLQHKKLMLSRLIIALLFICITTILLSGERTAFVSTMIAVMFVSALTIIIAPTKLRIYMLTVFSAMLVLVTIMFLTQSMVQHRFMGLFGVLENLKTSQYGQLFHVGYLLGADNWFNGVGFKGFRQLCPSISESGASFYCNLHPHNPYVEWFAETGLIGLCLFIAMVVIIFCRAIKSFRQYSGLEQFLALGILGNCIIHFFPLMPTQSFFSNWPAALLWYSLSVTFAWLNLLPRADKPKT